METLLAKVAMLAEGYRYDLSKFQRNCYHSREVALRETPSLPASPDSTEVGAALFTRSTEFPYGKRPSSHAPLPRRSQVETRSPQFLVFRQDNVVLRQFVPFFSRFQMRLEEHVFHNPLYRSSKYQCSKHL